jgi:hypothetical protein
LLNRHQSDFIPNLCHRIVQIVLSPFVRGKTEYDSIQKVLLWFFPMGILLLTATWFVLVTIGFGLMFWALETTQSALHALIASGSALSTLGFSTPNNVAGQLLSIPEGAIGLGVVVYLFTFVPGYLSTVQRREEKVAWLYARAGHPPSVIDLLESHQRGGTAHDMSQAWEEWERWFRELSETHVLSPTLIFVPSTFSGQSWISSAIVILDAAALALSSLNVQGRESAKLCYESGVKGLARISGVLLHSPLNKARPSLSRDIYEIALDRLQVSGISVSSNREESWQKFLELQAGYKDAAQNIAQAVFLPDNSLPLLFPRSSGYPADRPNSPTQ